MLLAMEPQPHLHSSRLMCDNCITLPCRATPRWRFQMEEFAADYDGGSTGTAGGASG